MIELAVLGLLVEGDLHGYELKKRLREVLGPLSRVSFGSLYPALGRLELAGAVRAVAADAAPAPAIPMTGSITGESAAFRVARRRVARGPRGKKVYGITDAGRARLAELIAEPGDDDRTFPVKLAFCRFADPATRLALLERRRDVLAERAREGRRSVRAAERLDRYVRSLVEHDTETIERDLAWLDRLIAAERAATEPDPQPLGGPR